MALLNTRPHALMLPFPAQGHIQAMMHLAKFLYSRGFYITFVNTEYIQRRLLTAVSVDSVKSLPDFKFETIPDGLPPEHGRTSKLAELCRSFTDNGPPHFENLIDKLKQSEPEVVPPVTCIISDGVVSFPQKTARKLGVPAVSFWTHSACGFSSYFFAPLLIGQGHIPLKDDEMCLANGNMDQTITCIPGMPPLRVKDLPFSLRRGDMLEIVKTEGQATLQADLVLLNTFDELDGPVVEALRKILPALYTIGPLVLQAESGNDKMSDISANMWTEETGCLKWLDCQKPTSVIYVSFGSIAVMSDQELLELAWGLEASKQPFLWVIRPDLIQGNSTLLPSEFWEKVKDRCFLVRWAPQMKVLSHPSVGGFLTHTGWNSTLESISAGVPMISRPFLAEQPINSKFISDVWKIGLSMKEVVTREDVEDRIRRLMSGEEGRQMRNRIGELRDESMRAIGKGGSSYNNLEIFLSKLQMGLGDS